MARPKALQVRVDDPVRERVESAARAAGLPVSSWLRRLIDRELEPPPSARVGLVEAWTDRLDRYSEPDGPGRQGLWSDRQPEFLLQPLPSVGDREFVVYDLRGQRMVGPSNFFDEVQAGARSVFLRGSAVQWKCVSLYEVRAFQGESKSFTRAQIMTLRRGGRP